MKKPILLLLLLTTISACIGFPGQSSPMNCESILPVKYQRLPFHTLSQSNAIDWIDTYLGLQKTSIEASDDADGGRSFNWKDESRSYWLSVPKYSSPRLTLYLLSQNPSLGDFLRCFGAPGAYRASDRIKSDAFLFEMWYPDKGIAAQLAKQSSGPVPPKITNELMFIGIVLVQPGSLNLFASRVYTQLSSQEIEIDLLSEVHEWPERLDEIKVKTR